MDQNYSDNYNSDIRLMYGISIQPTSLSVNATIALDTRRFMGILKYIQLHMKHPK